MDNIPLEDLVNKLSQVCIVALILHDRQIFTGQTILLQAMAMWKAIITTRTSGTIDNIQHNNTDILVSPGNTKELKESIEMLINDNKLRLHLGKSVKKGVKWFFART